MDTKVINGNLVSELTLSDLKKSIESVLVKKLRPPGLCAILIDSKGASAIYVKNKVKVANLIGIKSFCFIMSDFCSERDTILIIRGANCHIEIDGILVQLPLPRGISSSAVASTVTPAKDVDGLHPFNVAKLMRGDPDFIPCTPKGCIRLLKYMGLDLNGINVVIIGRSNIVGKPMFSALLMENATVTICHSYTKNLSYFTKKADVLISAVGIPGFVKSEHVAPGCVVLDVGISRLVGGKITGDVDFCSVFHIVSKITPVPGGVGPVTIAMLMENTWISYLKSTRQG